jgi:hypothetical protein
MIEDYSILTPALERYIQACHSKSSSIHISLYSQKKVQRNSYSYGNILFCASSGEGVRAISIALFIGANADMGIGVVKVVGCCTS